jgi:hypothetical protein
LRKFSESQQCGDDRKHRKQNESAPIAWHPFSDHGAGIESQPSRLLDKIDVKSGANKA